MRLKKLIVAGLAAYGGVQLAEKWAAANKELLQHKLENALIRGMQFIFGSPVPSGQVDDEERTYVAKLVKGATPKMGETYFYESGIDGEVFIKMVYEDSRRDHEILSERACYILRKG